MPASLSSLLDFPPPLPGRQELANGLGLPFTLWSAVNDTFGSTTHFDELCGHTLSLQYQGAKQWTLWAPFDLPGRTGGRAEADDEGGDEGGDEGDKGGVAAADAVPAHTR